MNPVIIAALVVGAATVGAVMLAVSAFRRPLPNLAGTLNAVFDTSDPLLTGPGLDGSTPTTLLDRWGSWLIRTGRLTPSHKQLALLQL